MKCFSITNAPKATAAIAVSIPKVWSEYPNFKLNLFFKNKIDLKFASLKGVDKRNYNEVK